MKVHAKSKEPDTRLLNYSLPKAIHNKIKQAALLKNADMRNHEFQREVTFIKHYFKNTLTDSSCPDTHNVVPINQDYSIIVKSFCKSLDVKRQRATAVVAALPMCLWNLKTSAHRDKDAEQDHASQFPCCSLSRCIDKYNICFFLLLF